MIKVLDRESLNRMTRNSGRGGSTYVGGGGGGYTLPLAADGTRGGVQIGYTTDTANKNYAVQLSNEKMYVNVPWTDTNTWRPLGTGANDACAGNDSRLSNARPASDVYSWAKAATKPSYNLDEVPDGNSRKLANYLPLSGGTMTGNISIGNSTFYANGSNGGINSLALADDCILGDCNIGGHLGLKSLNTSYAGISFYNSSGGGLGRITTDGTFNFYDASGNYANIHANNGYAEGTWASKSDARDKNVLGDIGLTVEDIAAMPAVRFTWKNRADKQVHIGTLAQAWQKKLPEAVGRTENGRLTFSYGEAAAVCVVKLAQRVLALEEIVNDMRYGTQQH